METNHCPTCHAPIPASAPGGFCPACLLRDAEEPPTHGHGAPPLEEIAAAFPQLEVLGLIGQGGMGFVYKVRQPSLDRIVALKILSPELGRDPAFAERFAREARTLGKLHHPNIVTVFEHGETGGFFYLTMEYVDGVNLRQAMRAGRFTPEQALAIVPGICDALQTAHEQGIWHRDIKPENILLDREGKVKIADFGIARIVGDPQRDFTLTRTGNALGSISYMAPEQHEKPHEVDHRADIYSLGVVIYEMLTGELPLGRFPSPSQRAAVDARIDEIVLKTLEKERDLRQQSATEVKTDIHRATQPEATGKARSEMPASSPKAGLAKLSFGLFLAGVLAFPLIAAVDSLPTIVALISALALLLLAFVFGVASWPELLARIVVITTGTLFIIGLAFMVVSLPHFTLKTPISSEEPSRLNQQIETMPTEAGAQTQPLPGYDFTSPRSAMESLIKAARERNARVFQNGFSKSFKAKVEEHGDSLDQFGDFGKCAVISSKATDKANAEVVIEASDGSLRRFTFRMILEDGEWKLNEFGWKP
jgi:serine/threonine protein kinase